MTTRDYLNQISRLNKLIENKLSDVVQLRNMAQAVTITPKEVDVQTSSQKDKMGDVVSKIVDLENEAKELADNYIDKRKHIVEQIEGLADTNMYHILYQKYVIGNDLSEIENVHYSYKQICRIHGEALKEFERLYGHEYLKIEQNMSSDVQ